MRIKKIFHVDAITALGIKVVILSVMMFSCNSEGDALTEEGDDVTLPKLISSYPANGASEIPIGKLSATFTFDQDIKTFSDKKSQITINNGGIINHISTSGKILTIEIDKLCNNQIYEINIGAGVIFGTDQKTAPHIQITFSTVRNLPEVSNELCTPNPLPQTQKVFDYLVEQYGKKTLSASMAKVSFNTEEAEMVHCSTGKYPAINFVDYIFLNPSGTGRWIDYGNLSQMEQWWNDGGLIGACWHWEVPTSKDVIIKDDNTNATYSPFETTFRAKNIFVDGSWEQKIANDDLKKMAVYLKMFQDKNIPVIWRPLHEGAGNIYEYKGGEAWFWWGADGAEVYKKLWAYMFEFFQKEGINNLIWVWTTQTKDNDFYPGDAYVDIVSRDLYNQEKGADNASQYNTILHTYSNKIIALSEFGGIAPISEQWNAGARWSFFMPWYDYNAKDLKEHTCANEVWWKDAFNQDYVITRDELPSFK